MVTLILTIIHVQANELTLNTGANVNFYEDIKRKVYQQHWR